MIQASNAARHPAHLKPFLLHRAAVIAQARNMPFIRITNATAWYGGGPGQVWYARAEVELLKHLELDNSSSQYSVSQILGSPLFSSSHDENIATGRIVGSSYTEVDGTFHWVQPIFIDTVSSEAGISNLYNREIFVEPRLHEFLVVVRIVRHLFGGYRDVVVPVTAKVEKNTLYKLQSRIESNILKVWLDDPSKPNERISLSETFLIGK